MGEIMKGWLDWLQTGWGYALVISGVITSYFAIKNNIKKLFEEARRPFNELHNEIQSLDQKMDDQTDEVNRAIEHEVQRVEQAIRDIKTHDETEDAALLAILKSDMLKNCEKYIKSGWATSEQKETLNKQLDSYLALGGNSFMPKLVAQVMQLPLEKQCDKNKE